MSENAILYFEKIINYYTISYLGIVATIVYSFFLIYYRKRCLRYRVINSLMPALTLLSIPLIVFIEAAMVDVLNSIPFYLLRDLVDLLSAKPYVVLYAFNPITLEALMWIAQKAILIIRVILKLKIFQKLSILIDRYYYFFGTSLFLAGVTMAYTPLFHQDSPIAVRLFVFKCIMLAALVLYLIVRIVLSNKITAYVKADRTSRVFKSN